MTRRWILTSLVVVLAASACSRDVDVATTTQDDMVAVARLMVTLDRVVSEEDLPGFLALVAEDAVHMPQGENAVVGRRAIGEFYRTLFAGFDVEIAHELLEVDAAGAFIIHRGNATGTIRPRGEGDPSEFDNKYLFVIKRGPEGSLQVWRTAYNTN